MPGYDFVPVPIMQIREIASKLLGNNFRVMNFIILKIFESKDSRATLTGEFSYKYIASKLHISHITVSKIIKKLEKKNFINILKSETTGATIKIILTEQNEEDRFLSEAKQCNKCGSDFIETEFEENLYCKQCPNCENTVYYGKCNI